MASVITTFQELGVTVSVQSKGNWSTLNVASPNMLEFESEYGRELSRWPHNDRMIAEARGRARPVVGEIFGFYDVYAPIELGTEADSFLVAGPFARTRPTGVEIADRWHAIASARADLADPSFARYLAVTLATLTLEGPLLATFERLLSCLALLLRGQGDAERLAREVTALNAALAPARASERLWEAARGMVDERTSHVWRTPLKRDPLKRLGIERPPEHALVALLRSSEKVQDPIADVLRRRAFQRAAAKLAYEQGNVACGQVADHGITLLSAFSGGTAATRAALVDLATRASALARRFEFGLSVGVAQGPGSQSLAVRYRAALAAAERALSRRASLAFAETRAEAPSRHLARLRARLADGTGERERVLSTRFERYAETAVVHANYRPDVLAAHLEAGLERLAEPLQSSGQLDRRTFEELCQSVERAPGADATVADVIAGYRRAVADIERAILRPTAVRQSRSRRRAIAFIRENLNKPLSLRQVSRVAGFAPNYFSQLLKAEEGMGFERYLQTLRLEQAKQTLAGTSLPIARVAELSGFKSRTYFQRVFRETTGMTPIDYRKRSTL
jgi:AraC-like DNA-binding protein